MDDFSDWIGRSESRHDVFGPTPVAALNATLDHPPIAAQNGMPLPPLWHWLYFLPLHRQSEIGPDGHAKRGGFLPPVPLPRRMWAGSQFEFRTPLRVGDHAERRSTIDGVTLKQGRSGPLVFVKVRHEIRIAGAGRVPRHRLPRRQEAGRRRAAAAARAAGRRLAARDRARRRAAVPLLGAHLQRPPHPLRPPLRHRGRGLPRPGRARPADRHAAAGPAAPRAAGSEGGELPLQGPGRAST